MQLATVLLIGNDQSLEQALREVIQNKEHCGLIVVNDSYEAFSHPDLMSSTVAVLHVTSEEDRKNARYFLKTSDRREGPRTIVVHEALSADATLEFLRLGAAECLSRPLNLTRLSAVLDMMTADALLTLPGRQGERDDLDRSGSTNVLHTPTMSGLMDQVRMVAPLDATVLITGETGTGKTRLSRLIHEMSPRSSKRFVAVNCGALSATLVESELFGHVRGAFTGADRDHRGKFAQCQDGTLLLDEIDTMSTGMQVKFLQVVEERVFEPVGSEKTEPLEARLVVASNKCLEEQVAANQFRADLFYRLNVISFHLPPLRQRRDEISPLARSFVAEFADRHSLGHPELAPDVVAALEEYHWPGNVRELRNVVERSVILSGGNPIQSKLLPSALRAGSTRAREHPVGRRGSNKLASARSVAERRQLIDALRRNGNNRSKTAAELGISRVALYKRLHKFQMI